MFGGTTAFSGGVLWIPDNHLARQQGIEDSQQAARTYLQSEAGESFRPDVVDAFLQNGPAMLRFFEDNTRFRCNLYQYPDYHPDAPGGVMRGRSVVPQAFDIRALGDAMSRLRKPLRTITFMGMMFSSSNNDLKHFFNATRSLTSFAYVVKRLSRHLLEVARYGRGITANGGNAVVARLACSALDLGIPIHTRVAAKDLIVEQGAVRGVIVEVNGERVKLYARRGVVLASGGFARDDERLKNSIPTCDAVAFSYRRRRRVRIPAMALRWRSASVRVLMTAIPTARHGSPPQKCRLAASSTFSRIWSIATNRGSSWSTATAAVLQRSRLLPRRWHRHD